MMQLYIRFSLIFSLLIICANQTFAQYDPGATASLGMGHGYNALSQSVMSNAFKNGNANNGDKANDVDFVQINSSHYTAFENKMVDALMANSKNNDKGKIRSFLAGSRTMYHFMMRTRDLGLKDSYISDIMATGIAWNWEMYHQTKASKSKVLNLRNSIRSNLANDGIRNQLLKLSEEEKRNWMLSFMHNNSMLAYTLKKTGKLSAVQKQQLAETAKQAGVPNIAAVSLK